MIRDNEEVTDHWNALNIRPTILRQRTIPVAVSIDLSTACRRMVHVYSAASLIESIGAIVTGDQIPKVPLGTAHQIEPAILMNENTIHLHPHVYKALLARFNNANKNLVAFIVV